MPTDERPASRSVTDTGPQPIWRRDLSTSARRISAGVVGGLLAGVVIGGLGGRLAMFVLRLTSDAALQGVMTDDGFTIGRFSGDTVFLIQSTGSLGALGGLFYLVVRPWIPARLRSSAMGVFGGVVVGSFVIRPGGIDSGQLGPLSLAVAMFIALPALYGIALSVLVDRLLRDESVLRRSRVWFLGLTPVIATGSLGTMGAIVVAVAAALWAGTRIGPSAASLWRAAAVVWIGRAGLVTVAALALWGLVKDIGQVL